MREIARYSGAQVVGINPCEYQLKRAAYHTKQDKLEDLCSYVKVSITINPNYYHTLRCILHIQGGFS